MNLFTRNPNLQKKKKNFFGGGGGGVEPKLFLGRGILGEGAGVSECFY